jgi:hypothetical protein
VITAPEVSLAADRSARSRRIAVASVAVAFAVVLAGLLAVRWHDPQPLSGDEPHYLIVSNSLWLDGDADVKNDYLDRRFLLFYLHGIDPHVNPAIFNLSSPHWYSQHGVGLPAVLVPGVMVGRVRGADIEMAILATVVLLLTFLWVRCFTGGLWLPAIAAAAIGFSPFFLGLEGRIFPDLATAALLLGCLLILELPRKQPWQLLLLGVLVGMSPWFHFKNALAFATVGVIALVQVVRSTTGQDRARRLLTLAAPMAIAAIGYELVVRDWYGSWLPTRMFPPGNNVFALSEGRGLAAASFDAARGLLTNNPALLLILLGLPLWMRAWPGPFRRLALIVAPTILLQATFNDWSGGLAPAGRYELQFAPVLAPAVAIVLQKVPIPVRALAGVLMGFQVALASAFIWLHPSWGFAGLRSPFFADIDQRLGVALDHVMPTFDRQAALVAGGPQLAAWLVVSAALVGLGVWLSRRHELS